MTFARFWTISKSLFFVCALGACSSDTRSQNPNLPGVDASITDGPFQDASVDGKPDASPQDLGFNFGDSSIPDSPLVDGNVGDSNACLTASKESELVPANVLFVIDRSGSMNCNPPPTQSASACESSPADPTKPSRWALTRDALKTAIKSMPNSTSVGIVYFPTPQNPTCGAPTSAAVSMKRLNESHRQDIESSLNNTAPLGGTPLIDSLRYAYIVLNNTQMMGNPFVVLITDGAESCSGNVQTLLQAVTTQATAKNVRTFVIGSPGSEGYRSVLSEIAFTGKTPSSTSCKHGGTNLSDGDCHFDMTTSSDFGAGLNKALQDISGASLSCDIPINAPDGTSSIDYSKVNVQISAGAQTTVIKQDEGIPCAQANGWQYSADKKTIVLCGEACKNAKESINGRIDILFGCKTVTVK